MNVRPRPTAFRALQQFETMPSGHMAVLVATTAFAPHLRVGEFAVVDTTDTAPQHGELFAIRMPGPAGASCRIVQMKRKSCVNDAGAFVGWFEAHGFDRDRLRPTTDGSILASVWVEQRCLGRVVGFMES